MSGTTREQRGELLQKVLQCGEETYGPKATENGEIDEQKFRDLLQSIDTSDLLAILNTLIQPGRVQDWLRPHLTKALSLVPLRPKGVRHVIDFVLAIHPSTVHTERPDPKQQRRGPNISLEALNAASKLLSTPPRDGSADQWFSGVAPQLLALLDGDDGPELVRCAAYIIGYGILGRKETGAPRTAGWKMFVGPMLRDINPSLASDSSVFDRKDDEDEVVSLKTRNTLVPAPRLLLALRRLQSLLTLHPYPALSKRLLLQLVMPLWSIASWPSDSPACKPTREPATKLLKLILQLAPGHYTLANISNNIMFDGVRGEWVYAFDPSEGIRIDRFLDEVDGPSPFNSWDLDAIGRRAATLAEILGTTKDIAGIDDLFLGLCEKWLNGSGSSANDQLLMNPGEAEDFQRKLVETKVLQVMMDTIPDKLIGNSTQVLILIKNVLRNIAEGLGRGEDQQGIETFTIVLSLLNFLLTSDKFRVKVDTKGLLEEVGSLLKKLGRIGDPELAFTAQKISYLLEFRMAEEEDRPKTVEDDPRYAQQVEDRRTYNLALSYLTSSESPPPVKAEGIKLLGGLIQRESPIIDVPATILLLAGLLQDQDEYIYLQVIRFFSIGLTQTHPKATIRNLMELYTDIKEESSLDARLRLGEALLQVIKKSGETFTGDLAKEVSEALLRIAGRRASRPKEKKGHLKKQKMEKQRAEKTEEEEVPDFGKDSEEEDEKNEVIRSIVEGWEGGKKGEEDIRVRASALSILGSAIETNVAGIGASTTSSAVDVSVHILAMETELEKGILRRSAVLLIMSLVRALDDARNKRKQLGFGLVGKNLEDVLKILRYVADTDNDGLVRQHAKDVVEGLDSLQSNDVLRIQQPVQMGLSERLAGLSINPGGGARTHGGPRIEEIE